MMAIVLALSLATAPPCVGDGHNQHRSKSAIKHFQKAWARAHGGLPCPEECALYRKVGEHYVMYQRCGGCQVDHICPLACCGLDAPQNMLDRAALLRKVREAAMTANASIAFAA